MTDESGIECAEQKQKQKQKQIAQELTRLEMERYHARITSNIYTVISFVA